MDKSKKTIIVIGVFVSIAIVTWYLTKSKPVSVIKDKAYWMKNIVVYQVGAASVTNSNLLTYEKDLTTYDNGYLQAWSDAIDANKDSFIYNNVTYMTIDGHTPTR